MRQALRKIHELGLGRQSRDLKVEGTGTSSWDRGDAMHVGHSGRAPPVGLCDGTGGASRLRSVTAANDDGRRRGSALDEDQPSIERRMLRIRKLVSKAYPSAAKMTVKPPRNRTPLDT